MESTEPSYDSFLDIVANLVGILVILIMVIGVRAQDAWNATAEADALPAEAPPPMPDVEAPKAEARALESELMQLAQSIDSIGEQIQQQLRQRDELQRTLSDKAQEIRSFQHQLESGQRREEQLQRDRASVLTELEVLQQKQRQQARRETKPIVIEHHPTPLAQAVFGREEHFRLSSGRLAYVPLNQLTEQLKSEARLKAWKLKDTPQITETVGPLEGFRLQYTLVRRDFVISTSTGPAQRSVVELNRFVLVPEATELGETLDVALQPGSRFYERLQQTAPGQATITVWTYPDSFAEFLRLKQYLQQRGYLTAARPLPEGHPIGGSPHGSRSMAQ